MHRLPVELRLSDWDRVVEQTFADKQNPSAHPTRLQSGHGIPTVLPRTRLALADPAEASFQAILTSGRDYSSTEPPDAQAAGFADDSRNRSSHSCQNRQAPPAAWMKMHILNTGFRLNGSLQLANKTTKEEMEHYRYKLVEGGTEEQPAQP
jgi:hypothetical protein